MSHYIDGEVLPRSLHICLLFRFPRPGAQHPYQDAHTFPAVCVRNVRIHIYPLPQFCHASPQHLPGRGERKGSWESGVEITAHACLSLGMLHMLFFSLSFPSSFHPSPLVSSLSSSPLITHSIHPLFSIAPGFFPNSFRRTLSLCSLALSPSRPLALLPSRPLALSPPHSLTPEHTLVQYAGTLLPTDSTG